MRILVSNDDGVYAPGLAMLVNSLKQIADVDVVAPDRDRSGVSNALTLDAPLRAHRLENGFVRVEGTPTDSVHLAITGLLKHTPDMVVSGINAGANLGDDILYSGTVAAAMEGRFLGLPAIAISLVGRKCQHFETAAIVAKQIVEKIFQQPLSSDTILNVNVPDVPYAELRGFEVTRLGKRHCAEPIVPAEDPRGFPIYWVGPAGAEADAGQGTDFYAIRQKKVSVTPLKLDLTHYESFEKLSQWLNGSI